MTDEPIRVKISTEAAGAIALTPVVSQLMTAAELVEHIVSVTGKDAPRVREILARGTFIVGGSRLRWDGWDTEQQAVAGLLARLPDADPQLQFTMARCFAVALIGAGGRIELLRETAARRRILRRKSFWEVLGDIATRTPPVYLDYSYSQRADRYRLPLDADAAREIQTSARLLAVSEIAGQVRSLDIESLEFLTAREPATGS